MSDIIFLTARDVRALLPDMATVVPLVAKAFADLACGEATNPAKMALVPRDGEMALSMLGHLARTNTIGFRASHLDVRSLTTLFDDRTGQPYAIYDAHDLGAMRTGATTALFARETNPAARQALIIGAGRQARTTAMALAHALPALETVWIYGRRRNAVSALITELEAPPGPVRYRFCSAPLDVLPDIDVVVGASGSGTPDHVCHAALKPGSLAVYVGHGIAADVLQRADRVLATSEQQMHVTGLDLADGDGQLPAVAAELADVLAGLVPARESADQVVAAYNSGMVIADLAVADVVIREARARSLGTVIDLDGRDTA